MIQDDRKQRLVEAMAESGIDMLLVYGNAWQSDYLRYTTDYSILEGQGLALVRADGRARSIFTTPFKAIARRSNAPRSRSCMRPTSSLPSTRHSTVSATSASAPHPIACCRAGLPPAP